MIRDDKEYTDLIIDWEVTSYSEKEMQLQLTFDEPDAVSQLDTDQLIIYIRGNAYFIARESLKAVELDYQMTKDIPP